MAQPILDIPITVECIVTPGVLDRNGDKINYRQFTASDGESARPVNNGWAARERFLAVSSLEQAFEFLRDFGLFHGSEDRYGPWTLADFQQWQEAFRWLLRAKPMAWGPFALGAESYQLVVSRGRRVSQVSRPTMGG
jgi:hypothetical protein